MSESRSVKNPPVEPGQTQCISAPENAELRLAALEHLMKQGSNRKRLPSSPDRELK